MQTPSVLDVDEEPHHMQLAAAGEHRAKRACTSGKGCCVQKGPQDRPNGGQEYENDDSATVKERVLRITTEGIKE